MSSPLYIHNFIDILGVYFIRQVVSRKYDQGNWSWHIMSSIRWLLQSHHPFRPTSLCSSMQKHCLSFNPLLRIIHTNCHWPRSILLSHASLALLPIDFHMSQLGKNSRQPHLYLTSWPHWYLGSSTIRESMDLSWRKNTSLHSRNLDIWIGWSGAGDLCRLWCSTDWWMNHTAAYRFDTLRGGAVELDLETECSNTNNT